MVPSVLNDYLAELYITIRKVDGSEYEPTSLENIKNSLERHSKDKGYVTYLRDRAFHKSNQALSAKKCSLKKAGLGRKSKASQALSFEDEKLMFDREAMGDDSPYALQLSLFYQGRG